MNILETTVLSVASVSVGNQVEAVARTRTQVFEMTQMAEDTVLRPEDFGVFSHELRAWLAGRIAEQAGDSNLKFHYLKGAGITENSHHPELPNGLNWDTLITFVDKAANSTRNVTADDIVNLQQSGFTDKDIVKLCQLIGFIAYQTRVVSGLRMMSGIFS